MNEEGPFQCTHCGEWFPYLHDCALHVTKCRTTKVWLGTLKSLQTKEFSP